MSETRGTNLWSFVISYLTGCGRWLLRVGDGASHQYIQYVVLILVLVKTAEIQAGDLPCGGKSPLISDYRGRNAGFGFFGE